MQFCGFLSILVTIDLGIQVRYGPAAEYMAVRAARRVYHPVYPSKSVFIQASETKVRLAPVEVSCVIQQASSAMLALCLNAGTGSNGGKPHLGLANNANA